MAESAQEEAGAAVFVRLPESSEELSFPFVPIQDFELTLRQLLSEHPQSCAYTNYRLVLADAEVESEPTYVTEAFDVARHLAERPEARATCGAPCFAT